MIHCVREQSVVGRHQGEESRQRGRIVRLPQSVPDEPRVMRSPRGLIEIEIENDIPVGFRKRRRHANQSLLNRRPVEVKGVAVGKGRHRHKSLKDSEIAQRNARLGPDLGQP